MIRSRQLIAVGSVGIMLIVIVLTTVFGSATAVRRMAAIDAEELARSWLTSLSEEFDLPGRPVASGYTGFDSFVAGFMGGSYTSLNQIDVFDPAEFEALQHFGSINGYAIFTRFGDLMIAGGTPYVRKAELPEVQSQIRAVLEQKHSIVSQINYLDTGGRSISLVMIPLEKNGSMRGVVSVEIERHRFETIMQRGVQLIALVTAGAVGAVGFFGVVLLYLWGRAASIAQSKATFLAYTDPLTKLPNRSKFEFSLPGRIAVSQQGGREISLIFTDVDDFKLINDTYGHAAGDRVVAEIGDRLRSIIDGGDTLYRISADHFAMIVQTPGGRPQAEEICERIQAVMEATFLADDFALNVNVSSGVSRCLVDGNNAEQLMKASDVALHRAKAEGGHTYRTYNFQMTQDIADSVRLRDDLEQALANDELHLVYQPQYEAYSRRLLGFEALARWDHPTEGPISPDRFIPVAEKSGLISKLGEWALSRACKEAQTWEYGLGVAVNLSPLQLRDSSLVRSVERVLKETGLPAHRLELEVTESVMMQDTDLTQQAFSAIRALGVGLAMDDFGTGYSSLSYLTRIPLTKLKIDKSFIDRYGESVKDDAIVNAVIRIGRDLGLSIIAEGVETERQAEMLTAIGCTSLQGYLLGRPSADPQSYIDAAKLDEFVQSGSLIA